MIFKRPLSLLVLLILSSWCMAQPPRQPVDIIVTPDHANWEYKAGEPAIFSIQVMNHNVPMKDVRIAYQIGPERMKPYTSDTIVLKDGRFTTKGLTMKEPGFLRCVVSVTVDGKPYRNLATAGYDVDKIKPTVALPADFDSFWKSAASDLAKLPIDARMIPLPERSSALTDVYQVNFQGFEYSRIYGILCLPKQPGKYPAVLQVPGAGIRPYGPDLELADKGIVVLTIGIHGIPVTLDPAVYNNLSAGALSGYMTFNMEDRDRYYYKRVYTNCIRANDFIFSLPQFDGSTLAVMGGSQGGALSIVTAGLDSRVKFLAAQYPAIADLTGYTKGRAGGWPHMLHESKPQWATNEKVIHTLAYYDVVNFARAIKVEGHYSWGFNDETCPPTSIYAAYNVITAPKQVGLYLNTGHFQYPEQRAEIYAWVVRKLKKGM